MKILKTTRDYLELLNIHEKRKILKDLGNDCYGLGYEDNSASCTYCHDNINCLSIYKEELNEEVQIAVEDYMYIQKIDQSKIIKNTDKILIATQKYQNENDNMEVVELEDLFMELTGTEDLPTIKILMKRFLKKHNIKINKGNKTLKL